VDEKGKLVTGIHYLQYQENVKGSVTGEGIAIGKQYLLAAHAIETPRLLLNSTCAPCPDGVANSSGLVGRNLMDHVMYLAWALADEPVYLYKYNRLKFRFWPKFQELKYPLNPFFI
jgi:choline dehydrogenase-like flavoprotein